MLALLTLCLLAVGSAVPASAHVELERSEPAGGDELDQAPVEVFLRFSGEVEEGSITIQVRGPEGDDVTDGQTQSGGRAAAVDLVPLTDNGVYRVRYEGVAADGHALQGRYRFRLSLAVEPSPPVQSPAAPTQAPTDPGPPTPTGLPSPTAVPQGTTVPWWPFALLLGVAALVGVTLLRRR